MAELFTRRISYNLLNLMKSEEAEFPTIVLGPGRPSLNETPEEKKKKYNDYQRQYQRERYHRDAEYRQHRKEISQINKQKETNIFKALSPIKMHKINDE